MCDHALKSFKPPTASSLLFKEECTLCFDGQDSPEGIDVCLSCFNGSCPRKHTQTHHYKKQHSIYLNIKRTPKPVDPECRPEKMTKLSVQEKSVEYDFETELKCIPCGIKVEKGIGNFQSIIDVVITGASVRKQADLKAWQEELLQKCYHTDELKQEKCIIQSRDAGHCNNCDMKENLWLCLVCGNLGCGRSQFGGIGGNGHGLAHFESTKHAVAVKMGSITPEGTADVFCYEHGTEILNPSLGVHLKSFGIQIESQEKTEKSIAELQLEQNLKFDFSMTSADGKELESLFGPGLTGIKNLGNSCYLASVVQVLLSIPEMKSFYVDTFDHHVQSCSEIPSECFRCQMGKLGEGLLSGRYSTPETSHGLTPSMFKELVGKGNPEFQSMRQQDAQEYLQHVLNKIAQLERNSQNNPTKGFEFTLENRLQCGDCNRVQYSAVSSSTIILQIPAIKDGFDESGKVKYQDVNLEDLVSGYFAPDTRTFTCPQDKKQCPAIQTLRIREYPEILVFAASRYVIGEGWVIEKLNSKIIVPEKISLDEYRAKEKDANEVECDSTAVVEEQPVVNEEDVAQLMNMGFPESRCRKALVQTGNLGPDMALNWLFEHADDMEDIPMPSADSHIDVSSLVDMGFTERHAREAMKQTNNNMERAVDWLFSHPDNEGQEEAPTTAMAIDTQPAGYELFAMISHKGTSAHCGHYVSFVKKERKWVLFNDEKVAHVPDIAEASCAAYLYFYRRIHHQI